MCRLEDANGDRNEWEDRRTISVQAWTIAGRSSDSDGGPWPLYRMYKRHRQWTLLLHASVGRLHSESTSGPSCPRCEWTMALATFSWAFSSDFRDLADAPHNTALQYFMNGRVCTASSLYSAFCIAHMRTLLYIFILLSSLVSHFLTRHFLVPPCALDDRVNLI